MKQRIISGAVIGVIIVVFGLIGGPLLAALMCVCSMIGYYELCRTSGVLEKGETLNAPVLIGLIGAVCYYVGLIVIELRNADALDVMMQRMDFYTIAIIICVFLVTMACYVFTFPKFTAGPIMKSQFCFLYAPILMAYVYRSRTLTFGVFIYALIYICSSLCDVCALTAGMLVGRHKVAPILSPKKTVEGCIGGVIGSALGAWICALIAHFVDASANVQLEFIIIGIIGSVIGMIGDLAASAIKRNYNIKDYGKLIPGHGGIMDRFDSIIFVAPVIYLVAVLLVMR